MTILKGEEKLLSRFEITALEVEARKLQCGSESRRGIGMQNFGC